MIQGFSSGLIGNRELIYETDLPSFQRDFASVKTLDHGTGPAITFTRASDATYFDANSVLQTASNNVPRFDHDAATGSSLGLLIEEARTNSIRNSQAGGSTNGVIGSGGVMPLNWSITPNANGVTSEIIGTGTENGLAYIDIKFSGTPTSTGDVLIFFDSSNGVTASNGQTWTSSNYAKLANGSLSNAVIRTSVRGNLSDGSLVGAQLSNSTITPTSSALKTQRTSATVTFSDATVVRVLGFMTVVYTNAQPIDLTLRIAAPQLEQGAFPTSYIPTTTAAATRSADSAIVTPISGFYNQAEGTFVTESSYAGANSAVSDSNRVTLQVDDTSLDNRTLIYNLGVNGSGGAQIITATAQQLGGSSASPDSTVVAVGTAMRFGIAYKANDAQTVKNATLGVADTVVSLPSVSRMRLGASGAATAVALLNGHIRKIAYWPKRLSNTLLQQLTT